MKWLINSNTHEWEFMLSEWADHKNLSVFEHFHVKRRTLGCLPAYTVRLRWLKLLESSVMHVLSRYYRGYNLIHVCRISEFVDEHPRWNNYTIFKYVMSTFLNNRSLYRLLTVIFWDAGSSALQGVRATRRWRPERPAAVVSLWGPRNGARPEAGQKTEKKP